MLHFIIAKKKAKIPKSVPKSLKIQLQTLYFTVENMEKCCVFCVGMSRVFAEQIPIAVHGQVPTMWLRGLAACWIYVYQHHRHHYYCCYSHFACSLMSKQTQNFHRRFGTQCHFYFLLQFHFSLLHSLSLSLSLALLQCSMRLQKMAKKQEKIKNKGKSR